ncbi:MAG: hypothetical protein K0R31_604 [Clostridiales bacterium]|jgi:hypothetical protein|nr:hypothetical protein [Clostridiales bacterium]
MLDKKKHHFLQLIVIFGSITILSLLTAWGFNSGVEAGMSMMGQSMGKMMSTMHASNITVSDLLKQVEQAETSTGMESHHNSENEQLKLEYFITTAVIVTLLPFIVAGAVFLGIIWLK